MKPLALLRPKVLLPTLLGAALLLFAFSLGNAAQVLGLIRRISLPGMALAFLCTAVYLWVKGYQLRVLLRALGARIDRRGFMLAYAVGELAATLPMGVFAQNWVLSQQQGIRFGRGVSATAAVLLMELVIAVLTVAAVGIPGREWMRGIAVALLAVLGALTFGLSRFGPQARRVAHNVRHVALRRVLYEALGLIRGLQHLSGSRVLAFSAPLTAAHLLALLAAFVAVGHAMGVGGLHFAAAASIYAFALAVVLMGGGVFGQIGSMEVLGMNVAKAWGIDYTQGLALMFGFRLVWTASVWLVCAPAVWWLRHHLQPARAARASGQRGEETAG